MAQLLSPAPPNPPRMSQLLPTVKCSNCGNLVPLDELGEHTCPPPPKQQRPPPSSLLPNRIQNQSPDSLRERERQDRTPSPQHYLPRNTSLSPTPSRTPNRSLDRVPSPLARADSNQSSNHPRGPPAYPPERLRTASAPRQPYQPFDAQFSHNQPRQDHYHPPPQLRQTPPPPTIVSEVDTKIGGAAGMAGVGRRGFAAAARAAMFAASIPSPIGTHSNRTAYTEPQPQTYVPPSPTRVDAGREPESPRYLDINTTRPSHFATTPPPLSPGSAELSEVDPDPVPPSPSSGSEYGLAYADSTDYEDDGPHAKSILRTGKEPPDKAQVRFPTLADKERKQGALQKSTSSSTSASSASRRSPRGAERSVSGRSAGSSASGYSRSTHNSDRALDRAMETLFEDGASSSSSRTHGSNRGKSALDRIVLGEKKAQRSNTVAGPGPSPATPTTSPHPPRRSHTSPTYPSASVVNIAVSQERDGERRKAKKVRVCVRCEKRIEDGRWIQTDGGGVLCERCWKNMYLPKCRRCNLSIEKQAVSSSDGQLKGKYHRECFNCHKCHKSFPDKTFYIFDGKPLCAYHYHEANDSLCAAATCGQPIEGPCAVSHAGDRYHPAHLLCEYSGYPRCVERLVEYWEVDGRMLCERHAHASGADEEDERNQSDSRARKRVTRFIDLAGGVGLGLGGAAGGEDSDVESDLR